MLARRSGFDYRGRVGTIAAIDLSEFTDGNALQRRRLAARVDETCRQVGFLTVSRHGVNAAIRDRLWRLAHGFFELEPAEKQTVAPARPGDPYGYFAPYREALAGSRGNLTPPDLKESFNAGPPNRPAGLEGGSDERFFYTPTRWPSAPADFRRAWLDYYQQMSALAATLMRLFALALGLPEDWFDGYVDHHVSAMRALNYPPLDRQPRPGQLRAGAHTDYGSLTILLTDPDNPGLEIRSTGRWLPVAAPPDAFIVNLGDLMARWTNDRWVSTLHRVVNPASSPGRRRQAIAFFHQPNFEAHIACIPTCLAPGEHPRYPPVRSGPYLMDRFRGATEAIA